MPMLLDRVPLPTLRSYVLCSAVMLSSAVIFALTHLDEHISTSKNAHDSVSAPQFIDYIRAFFAAITSELWSIWALINTSYCLLILLGKGIQVLIFGDLRVSELQQMKDKFWNFAFYKFIFIFGVLNVQFMNDAFLWTAWFSFLCGLHLFAQLCKDRFEYLSCSPTTPRVQHIKLMTLLSLITLIGICLVALSFAMAMLTDWNTFGFMIAECLLLDAKTIYVLLRYAIYLVDLNHDGLWERRGILAYYTELGCEMVSLFVDLIHHIHMVVWSNIFLSMASLVICMQIRFLFNEIQKRLKRHKNYLEVVRSMEARFSWATAQEVADYNDNCAICWDRIEAARKLPCGHLFHNSCLRSWLAQDTSCPTCRINLSESKQESSQTRVPLAQADRTATLQHTTLLTRLNQSRLNRTNHFFHFDASRYISWLPSFSVEVSHSHMLQPSPIHSSQLDTMARQVQDMFPSISPASIMEDLQTSHSVEVTIENILEGRVIVQPPSFALADVRERSYNDSDSSETESDYHNTRDYSRPFRTLPVEQLPELLEVQEPFHSMQSTSSEPQTSGTRFSKDASERENLLQSRKLDLLNHARQKYIDSSKNKSEAHTASDSRKDR